MANLIIGAPEREQIAKLKEFAAANLQDVVKNMKWAEKDLEAYLESRKQFTIVLPDGFIVVYTHEMQPAFRPFWHLSVGVRAVGRLPNQPAVEMILQEFGMRPLGMSDHVWLEDVGKGEKAVNVLQCMMLPLNGFKHKPRAPSSKAELLARVH